MQYIFCRKTWFGQKEQGLTLQLSMKEKARNTWEQSLSYMISLIEALVLQNLLIASKTSATNSVTQQISKQSQVEEQQ